MIKSLIFASTAVLAHGWYDGDCCSDKDCAPYPAEQVREMQDGYFLPAFGQLVKHSYARLSHDGQYHACVIGEHVHCLYVPRPAM